MKFRNNAGDERQFPAWGLAVADGDEFELTAEQAAGLVLQCGEDGLYSPVDDEAKQAVADAFAALEVVEEGPPAESALKPAWVAYAAAQGDPDPESKTKQQLIELYGTKETS